MPVDDLKPLIAGISAALIAAALEATSPVIGLRRLNCVVIMLSQADKYAYGL